MVKKKGNHPQIDGCKIQMSEILSSTQIDTLW